MPPEHPWNPRTGRPLKPREREFFRWFFIAVGLLLIAGIVIDLGVRL